jgi:hypothetical protein
MFARIRGVMNGVQLSRGREAGPAFSPFLPATTPVVAGFFTLDLVTWAVECDDQTYALHGVDPGAPPRLESFLDRVPRPDLPAVLEAINELTKGCGDYRVEYRIARGDDDLRAMEARGRVLGGDDGTPRRMIGIVTDTSDYRAQRDAEHEFAARLQRQMLPSSLVSVPGMRFAARYKPATDGMLIGGDWYDIVPRPDGSVVLVIGDVQGHSVEAACFMGQLRAGLRAFLGEGHELARALAMTNRMLISEYRPGEDGLFASCCLAALMPGGRELRTCTAGHLPPAVASARAEPSIPDVPAGLLLGVEPDVSYRTVSLPLPPDSTVFLCTDGLLECGPGDLEAGLDRVLPVLAAGHATDLEDLADLLVAAAAPQPVRHDDIAVLLARVAAG